MAKAKRRKYSKAEERAYFIGYGVSLAHNGNAGRCLAVNGKVTESFCAGKRAGKIDSRERTEKRLGKKSKLR